MAILRPCAKLLVLVCLSWQFAANGWAQSYPAKTVRYLVHSSAGSGTDTLGRIIAGGLTQAFGQQVIVDNRPGAAGNIAAEIAAKAPANGYTLFQVTNTHAINVSLYSNLSYDLVRDFAPVMQLASTPAVVVVHPSLPVKSIGELVKLAKAKPGAINHASAGTGTVSFFAAELFKSLAGVNMLHVPYKGGGEALTSVITGETSVYVTPLAPALPLIDQRRLRALAVTTLKRLRLMPEYPTVAETVSGYEFNIWYGLLVPVKTPKETVATIRNAAVSVLNNPNVSKRLSDLGYIAVGDQPEEFAAYIKSDIEKLAKIIRQHRVTAN